VVIKITKQPLFKKIRADLFGQPPMCCTYYLNLGIGISSNATPKEISKSQNSAIKQFVSVISSNATPKAISKSPHPKIPQYLAGA
jgi:hypothetical protein